MTVAVRAPHVDRAIVDVGVDLKSKDKVVSRHGASGTAGRALGLEKRICFRQRFINITTSEDNSGTLKTKKKKRKR